MKHIVSNKNLYITPSWKNRLLDAGVWLHHFYEKDLVVLTGYSVGSYIPKGLHKLLNQFPHSTLSDSWFLSFV